MIIKVRTSASALRLSVFLLSFCLCGLSAVEAQQPNIIWINAEDMSPHLGCYGHPNARTPNIDRMAESGIVYRNAFATAPICSPARSCLATGLYATSLGTQHLRCEVEIPESIVPLAVRLRALGYYCTNTGKTDYNFDPEGIWDAWNNGAAPWNAREADQPFFAFITVGETHEGRINFQDRYQQAVSDLPDEWKHDPQDAFVPPFYPDTPDVRRMFAQMYDLATVFDIKVGRLLERLESDGDVDNTFVFVFGDHGNGLPRYKRWLNDSGLRVPLVVHVPDNYRHLSPIEPGTQTDRLVSFVDFPATAIRLAGADQPDTFQGIPFLGEQVSVERQYVFGARSRADDMFEVSRSVSDGRYLYVRHFMPHLPYIQPGVIFDNRKLSFRLLRQLHREGNLDEHAAKMWAPHKPLEELYDLAADPFELTNLASDERFAEQREQLSHEMHNWILDHRDIGFLPEAEYQLQSRERGITPYEFAQDSSLYDLEAGLSAAWAVGDESIDREMLLAWLSHSESSTRYWAAISFHNQGSLSEEVRAALIDRLQDSSACVRIAAADALLNDHELNDETYAAALQTLKVALSDPSPWVALHAARSLALLGDRASPLIDEMKTVIQANLAEPGSPRPYKDFNYASFTGWALETALRACGEETFVEAIQNR